MTQREECLHTMRVIRHHKPTDRYLVQLQYFGHPATQHWISERQYRTLERAFERTPYGYSTKHISVVGVFEDERFCYAKWELQEWFPSLPPVLEVPEYVEVAPELRDE